MAPCGCPGLACLSRVCSARVRLCSHHHHLPADTKFPILSQQREWKEGKRPRPEGGGQGRSWLLCPGASFQPRSGARPQPGLPEGGTGQPQAGGSGGSGGRGAWVLSSHLARGSSSGSLPWSSSCPAEEPWAGGGFWRLVLFRPQHSCPRVSQSWEPPLQRTSGLVGRGSGSPFPGPGTLREGGAGRRGLGPLPSGGLFLHS